MAMDRSDANRAMLAQASDVQSKTKDAIRRTQMQAVETETLAALTLSELGKQGIQMDEISAELDTVAVQLDKTQVLQNQFDRWAFNFFGGKKNAALQEANKELAKQTNTADDPSSFKIREVFEMEKFDSISRIWRTGGVFLCSNPTVPARDIFSPPKKNKKKDAPPDDVSWVIDYSQSSIDGEGWTYAYDSNTLIKNGSGDSSKKWNSYIRRRKWCLEDKKVNTGTAGKNVRERHTARIGTIAATSGHGKEKIGYVPRGKGNFTESGFTSAGMMGKSRAADQTLDEESQMNMARLKSEDEEIDQGIDGIGNTVDTLTRIAGDMNSEIRVQNSKISSIDNRMQKGAEKQAIVNARLKSLVKNS